MNGIGFVFLLSGMMGIHAGFANDAMTGNESKESDYGKSSPQEIRQNQIRDSVESARKQRIWENSRESLLASARLDLEENTCVAFDRSSRECLLTAGQFNASIPAFLPPHENGEFPKPSAPLRERMRRSALNAALDEAFQTDPRSPLFQKASSFPAEDMAPRSLPPGLSEQDIKDAFRDHFLELARRQGKVVFDVFAATDSGLIDSLWHSLSVDRPSSDSTGWAPTSLSVQDAPEAWILKSQSMRLREWSEPMRTPFGYAFFRINRRPPTERECRSLLIPLAYARKNALPLDWERRSRDYYGAHRTSFAAQDSLDLDVRLLPRPKGVRGGTTSLGSGKRGEDSVLARVARAYPLIRLSRSDLPSALQPMLPARYAPGFSLQGQPAAFGYWWIQVRAAKRGMGILPYEKVQVSLTEKLKAEASDSTLGQVLADMASKQKDKRSSAARQALLEQFADQAVSESQGQAQGIGDTTRTGNSGTNPEGSDDAETIRRARVSQARLQQVKRDWIDANVRISLPQE